MAAPNHYELLGLRADASLDEIEEAFRRRTAQFRAGTPEFDRLLDAYNTLRNLNSRASYNQRPEVRAWIKRQRRPFWQFGRRAKTSAPVQPREPTLSQLLDFDWESLEEPVPDTPAQRKAFYEELYFKIAVVAIVLAAIAVIFWALRNS